MSQVTTTTEFSNSVKVIVSKKTDRIGLVSFDLQFHWQEKISMRLQKLQLGDIREMHRMLSRII